uniref:C-type lectin domain-containing protein n=1 Tax=Erpetoichthys calabaricus TaxID=27687 RepID=A0A8C4SWI2_ERPCA
MGVLLFCLGYLYPSKNLKGKKKTQQRERTLYDIGSTLVSTWEEAMDYCRERNSNLISISSQVEQDAIAALVNTTNSTNVWLGLRQSRLFGFWFWIDEKPLSYEKWVHGPPSQLPASSPCAAMSQQNNFSWINVSCSETYSFICRYK